MKAYVQICTSNEDSDRRSLDNQGCKVTSSAQQRLSAQSDLYVWRTSPEVRSLTFWLKLSLNDPSTATVEKRCKYKQQHVDSMCSE